MTVDGVEREATPWPEWAITTVVETSAWADTARRAVARHRSQMAIYERFNALPPEEQAALWGRGEFYRAMSTVSGGRERETDLFHGIGGERVEERVA